LPWEEISVICLPIHFLTSPWDDLYLDEIPIESLLGEGVDVIVEKLMKSLDMDTK